MHLSTKQRRGLILALFISGFLMRAPITTPPLFLTPLAHALQTQPSQLGILTTLPLLMFMICSNFGAPIMQRLGLNRALLLSVALLAAGSLVRLLLNLPAVLAGTVLIGIGIALLNVLMPVCVAHYFPKRIGQFTAVYSFAMIFGNTVCNLSTAPLNQAFGWNAMFTLLGFLPLAIVAVWLWLGGQLANVPQPAPANPATTKAPHLWTNPRAWFFLLTFGGQSTLNYTVTAWLPSLMAYHHLNSTHIGWVMAAFTLISLPIALFLPSLLAQLSQRWLAILTVIAGACGIVAALMLFHQNTQQLWFWILESSLIGLHIGFFFMEVLTMFGLKTSTPQITARLSGMAQAGGYCLAAVGPTLYGWAFAANPLGQWQNVAYLALVLMTFGAGWQIVHLKQL
jgi:CP family cyanate transporter-like MFS transporter